MNKLPIYVFNILAFMMMANDTHANHSSTYFNDSYNYDEQNQNDKQNHFIVDNESWETTSSRMNRQAGATSNTLSNSNQNREDQSGGETWETTSSRMNRQASSAANNRSNLNWNRDDQNFNDRGNVQR